MSASRPNILLIVMDCARSDKWLGPNRATSTPTLDRLATGGVSFRTTIAETSCTTPCFAGLLTGAYSFQHGVSSLGGHQLAPDLPTLAEVLRANGYRTYMEATGPLLPLTGMGRGFDEYNYRVAVEYLHTRWGGRLLDRLRRGGLRSPWFLVLHLWELHLPRQILPAYRSKRFGATPYERAVASLDSQLAVLLDAAGPNTMTIVTGDHGEKTAAEEYLPGTAVHEAARLYGAERLPRVARLGPHWLIGPVATLALRARYQSRLEALSQRRERRRLAHGWVTRARDTWTLLKLAPRLSIRDVLRLRSAAGRGELAETTDALDADAVAVRLDSLVARIGDEALFDVFLRMWSGMLRLHLLAGHVVHVYEFLVRVPLVLHWPGALRAGATSERMVRQVDIAATILDLLGIATPACFSPSGQTLAPLIRGESWSPRPAFLSVSGQPRDLTLRGVRTETHKLTYGAADADVPVELYDLTADPREQRNLATVDPARVAELRGLAESMLPAGGARIERLEAGTRDERMQLERRMRELGYA